MYSSVIRKILALVLAVLMLSAISFVPASAQETRAGHTAGITVISLGAEQMQAEGAAAIQNALFTAKKNAKPSHPKRVCLE